MICNNFLGTTIHFFFCYYYNYYPNKYRIKIMDNKIKIMPKKCRNIYMFIEKVIYNCSH